MANGQMNLENVTTIDQIKFEHLDEKYKYVLAVGITLVYVILMLLSLFLLLVDSPWWCALVECSFVIALGVNLAIVTKAYQFKGYVLGERDITYRKGIVFAKTITIPYSRIQQVSVKQNPVSNFFHLYTVEIVNGAQEFSSLNIPGLTENTAKLIKSHLIEHLEDRYD